MKKVLIVLILAASIGVKAQTSGVYLTAADFESGKLAYAIDCSKEKHKIKLNEFLGRDYITVIHDNQPHNLKKEEIFGYKNCNDVIYRLSVDKHYQVLNPKEKILLYKIEFLPSKNQNSTTSYFFSNTATGEVKELTLTNLKNAFSENHRFHDALDAEFKSNENLARYDSFHKVYKINRLYASSLSN